MPTEWKRKSFRYFRKQEKQVPSLPITIFPSTQRNQCAYIWTSALPWGVIRFLKYQVGYLRPLRLGYLWDRDVFNYEGFTFIFSWIHILVHFLCSGFKVMNLLCVTFEWDNLIKKRTAHLFKITELNKNTTNFSQCTSKDIFQ